MFKGGAHAEATIQTMLSLSTAASRQFADDSADGAWPTADNCELIASTVKKEEKKNSQPATIQLLLERNNRNIHSDSLLW